MNGSVVAYVLEVLEDGLADIDFADGDAQTLHESEGVLIGAVGGAEARHRDADDVLAVIAQLVERAHSDEQRQRGVKPAADADDDAPATGVDQSLGESHSLNAEDVVAALCHVAFLGNEWQRIDGAFQLEVARRVGAAVVDANLLSAGLHVILQVAQGIDVGGVGTSLVPHALDVDLLDHHLARQRESLALSQQAAVLIDEGIASEDDVLRGLAEAAGAVDVGRDGACALLREDRLQIGVLAHELVAGGEVEDDVGTGQGQLIAGGSGRPDVLAHLDAEEHVVARAEELCLWCELYGAACETDFHGPQVLS